MKKGEKTVKKTEEKKVAKPSKKAFILSIPFRVPAADVVARGAVEGIDFTVEYVHTVRSKKRTDKSNKKPKKPNALPSSGKFSVPQKVMKISIEGQGGGGGGSGSGPSRLRRLDDLVWSLGVEALKKMLETASKVGRPFDG
jgi:hypothetical protein